MWKSSATFAVVFGAWGCSSGSSGSSAEGGVQDSGMIMDTGTVVSESGPEASGADTGTASGMDAGKDGNSAPEAGPGCPAMQYKNSCNVGTQCGPVVTLVAGSGAAPTAMGGTIVPGMYFLTAATIHGGTPGTPPETYQITMNLDPSGSYWVNSYDFGDQATPSSGTYTTANNMFTRSESCPAIQAPYSKGYTATSTSLTLYESNGNGATIVLVETKQ